MQVPLPEYSDVVVVGAGPAGLSAAHALRRRGVDCIVLEAGDVGETWRRIPSGLTLLNPWWQCAMDWRSALFDGPFTTRSARDMLTYLTAFARDLPIVRGARVSSVAPGRRGYVAETVDGRQLRTRAVVCASGYYANPAPMHPRVEEDDGSVHCVHFADLRDYDELARMVPPGGNALVVGKRITAGQLLVELDARGRAAEVSARSPIRFGSTSVWRRLRVAAYSVYEPLRLAIQPERRGDSWPTMHGGRARELIDSGRVTVRPPPAAFRAGEVVFVDGSRGSYDVVLLATGYLPALDFLEPLGIGPGSDLVQAHSPCGLHAAPGVFLLGFDNLRSLRSRYLRGIRADAGWIADAVAAFLRKAPAP